MRRAHWKIVIAGCLVIFVVILFYFSSNRKIPLTSTPNLLEHPIYSKYEFDNTDRTIRIGTQPLYLPGSLITEALKRDTILKEELSKMGLKILFYDFLKGDDINFFLTRGDLDGGVGGDMPALTTAANIDIVIPAMIQRGFVSIVANRQMLIEDLKGERIGYAFGSNAHYALIKTLASAGLSENDVQLIPMDVTKMPELLNNGEITAFCAWEPTPTMALRNYTNSTIIHQRLSLGFFYFLRTVYQKHPDAVSHILAAQIRAISWIQEEKQNLRLACEWSLAAGEQAFGLKINLSINDIAAIAMKDILGQIQNPGIAEDDIKTNGPLHQEFMFLIDIGKIPASISWHQTRKKFIPKILDIVWVNRNNYRLDEFKYQNGSTIHSSTIQ
jgi:NMT1-like family